jgi:2-polyprenyl-6-methoxyphenol hydroxylase-like FAD-dependent oxidoreductase
VTSGSRSAVIVGAGIGGLAAAIALRRAGWDVRVVEQAASVRELGFALALAPNALAALEELGLRDLVAPRGVVVRSFEVRHLAGPPIKRIVLPGAATHSIILLRSALHGTLLDAIGIESVVLGRSVTGFTREDLAPLSADVVIGADGIGSTIRRALHPREPAPRPSGYHALRGVSEAGSDALGDIGLALYLGDGVEIGLAKASPSAIYWYVSAVDEFATGDVDAMLERCISGLDARAAAIIRATPPGEIRRDQLFTRRPLERWGAGNVTLLGDAAHPVLPHTAQGAALALEDAVALGLALRLDVDPVAGLRRYEDVRAARTRRTIAAGPRIASLTTTRSRSRIFIRHAALWLLPAGFVSLALNAHARDPHGALRTPS